jgi:DNA modification methylase
MRTQKKERLNDLDGKTWERYSISIWSITKTPEEAKFKHPAMFPVELCKRLIEIYTKVGETVLDPFMGSGSTLVAAKKLGRKGIGFDINPEFVNLARERLSNVTKVELGIQLKMHTFSEEETSSANRISPLAVIEPEIYCEDAEKLLDYVPPNSVDLCITSPPYWEIHRRKRTADYKEPRPYSQLERDLANIPNYDQFLVALRNIFAKVFEVLKSGKRCVVIVMDLRVLNKFIPYHIDVINFMNDIGFRLEDIIIWDRRLEYSNLRPLGYPYVFIVNKVHEYILIFRKESK